MTVWKLDGPLVLAKTVKTGSTRRHVVGAEGDLDARALPRAASLAVSLSGDAQLFPDGNTVDGLERRERAGVLPNRADDAPRPARRDATAGAASSSPSARPRSRARSSRATPTTACSARTSTRSPTDAVRIAFDVSPLSHPATGVGNYIRGSLAGLARGGRRASTRSSRSRPTSIRGPARDPRRARGARRRAADVAAAVLARGPDGLEHRRPHPAAERLLGAVRRAALHRLDVPAAARGRAGDDDPRPRAAALPGVDDEAHAGDARPQVPNAARTCDVVFVNSAFTGRDVTELLGVAAGADPGRASRRQGRCSRRTGGPPTSGRRTSLTVATLEPRKNLQALVEAHRLLGGDTLLAVVGRRGLGRAAGARRSAGAPARLRLRRGARAPLPRRRRRRLPVALRGLRDADRRGDGLRHARRRLGARVAGRGERRRRAPGRPRRSRRDRRRDRARARAPRRSSWRPASSTRRGSPGVATGEAMLARLRGGAVRVGLDVAAARADRRRHGTARPRPAAGARGPAGARDRAALVRRPGRAATVARDVAWYPGGIAWQARDLDVLHCTTMRGPLRARPPVVVTVHDLALLRVPEAFPAWHRHYRQARAPARASARPTRSSRSRPSRRDELVALLDVPVGADPRLPERRRARLRARRPGRRGGLRPRRRARSSRARTSPGPSRRPG